MKALSILCFHNPFKRCLGQKSFFVDDSFFSPTPKCLVLGKTTPFQLHCISRPNHSRPLYLYTYSYFFSSFLFVTISIIGRFFTLLN
ncbi:BDC_1c_G0008740.mRNA.1.CDS.1 [Saccharomyces cerevisiae]|nr:BDF_1d_G0008690.mRNA.1.CDS.1 [Saccharomyces cerevisiae]CAI4330848.1 BDC_1c_G0008740.mRNA.1.CDS.1 [Saccharomyces cerevisiae]CAI7067548.1 BDF_1d_G0008690.mRNA.1.CDS.1 [Saccharomyces cerevisiae]CAI7068078.1 BDC_1c_G0008740.mRNA.1.CDS.1 [Saccharomyces cerevisiae]